MGTSTEISCHNQFICSSQHCHSLVWKHTACFLISSLALVQHPLCLSCPLLFLVAQEILLHSRITSSKWPKWVWCLIWEGTLRPWEAEKPQEERAHLVMGLPNVVILFLTDEGCWCSNRNSYALCRPPAAEWVKASHSCVENYHLQEMIKSTHKIWELIHKCLSFLGMHRDCTLECYTCPTKCLHWGWNPDTQC